MYLAHNMGKDQNGSALDTLNGSLRLWVPGTFVL